MSAPAFGDMPIIGSLGIEGKVVPLPTHDAINERISMNEKRRSIAVERDEKLGKGGVEITDYEIKEISPPSSNHDDEDEKNNAYEGIIVTGADVSGIPRTIYLS